MSFDRYDHAERFAEKIPHYLSASQFLCRCGREVVVRLTWKPIFYCEIYFKECCAMSFKSDIEIAQEATPLKITEVAKACGIDEKYIELYGN